MEPKRDTIAKLPRLASKRDPEKSTQKIDEKMSFVSHRQTYAILKLDSFFRKHREENLDGDSDKLENEVGDANAEQQIFERECLLLVGENRREEQAENGLFLVQDEADD